MRTSIHPKNLLITASNAAKTCLAGLALLLAVSAMPAIAQAPGVTLTVLDGGGPGSGGLPSGYIASRDGTLAGAVGTQIPITNVAGVTLPVGSKEDISSGNGFVRTHDVVGFNVGITPTAGAMSNVVITLDYAGVTNAAGAPINNINGNFLTANNCVIDTSGGSLFVGSKIVCTIPAIPATGFTLFAKFMVAGAAAGSIVPLPNITVSGTGFTAVTLPRASMVAPSAGDLTVLAAPNWLVKVGPAQAGQDSLYMPAMGRNGEPGYVFAYPVVVFAEGSRVGLEPLNTAGMSMDLALTSTGTAVPTTKLINWTPANTQTTSVLQFNPTYSHGGANDTSDGGGVNNIYGAGLNQTSACVSGGALFRQVGANTVPPNGYFEYRGLAAGAPASAVNNPGGAPGSPQLGGGNPLGGLTPPFGTMGGTINLGDCDLRYSGNASNVTHNTPATSPAGATHNFSMTVKGNNNSLLPLGHLNEYYSQTVGSTNNQAISPAYRVSAVQPAAFATPALSDMFNFGINPNGEDQLTPAQVAKQRWISANKDIPFYVNASDLSAAGATVTYTLVGSNISATSLSGQTNPATNLQIGPTYSMVGGTPVAANAIANKRTITIASVNLGIDKFVQSGGGRTAATGEIVAKNASGSANQYYLYTQQGQWSSWRVATSNVSNNPKYLRRMCEKIDNTRMNLMFAKDVYPSNILFHDELVMLDGVNTGNAYLTGVVSPFVSGAAGTSNDPRNLVFSPYARWKIEYGIRTTPRASDGAFTWDSSFALRSPGNPLNIRTNFPDTTGSSGGLNSLPGGPAVASQQRDANCDDDVNVTWYNTASQSLTSWKPITHRQAPGLLLQEYDSAYTGTVAINRLATADWGKVQYVRVTPVDVNGNRIYNLEISSNTTNYTALHLPSAPKSMLSYGWVGNAGTGTNAAIGAGGDAIPSVAAGSTTNNTVSPNYASVDYGLTGVQTATITNLKTAATITITPQQLYLAVTKINATTNLSMDLGTIQKYVLTPSFNAATSPAIAPETIFLHDVIPPELSFLAAAGVTYGNANITGVYTSTALGAPTGAPATGTVVEVFKDQRYGATGVLITDAGFTTLRIRLESVAYNAVLPSVSYSTQVTTAGTAVNRTVSNAVCVTSVNNQSLGNTPAYTVSSSQASPPPSTTGGAFNTANSAIGGCTASAFALNRISDVVGLSLSKIASPAKVEPGAAQKFVISYGATGNTAQYAFRVIDILPFNGDNTGSTSFRANALANATTGEPAHFQTTAGNFNLTSGITVTPVGSSTNSPPPYIILYTADARNTVNGDPGHTTNWPLTATGATSQGTNVAATTWCTESGGVFTYNRGASARPCPTSFAGVSAFMVEHDTALAGTTIQSTLSYRIDVDGITAGSLNGQWTGNSTRGVSSSAPMVATPGLIPTKYAGIQFATQAISGNVYRDLNNDGVKNVLDNGVPNVLVRLEKLTGAGGTVVAGKTVWTFTTAAGGYNFGCLPNAAATAFDFNGCTNTGTLFLENGTSGNRNTTAEVAATSLYQGVLSGYYKITEYQPNGYVSASNNLGTCGGTATAYTPSAATNEITDIQVSAGLDCINYRFGEIEREISVSKVGTNPRKIAGFAYKFAVDYAITVKNTATGAFAASNVQVNDNVMRTFQRGGATPTVVVSGLVVSMAPAAGSTCTLNAAYTGLATTATSTALLSGTDSLAQGASCVINFTATVDYGTATPPTNILCSAPALTYATGTATATEALATTGSQSGCNTAYVSTNETGANTAGWTVPNNPAAAATFTGTGSYDLSNDGPLVRTSDTPTPVVWPFSSVGLAKAVKSGTAARPNPQQMGNSAFLVTYAFKLQNNSTTTDATNVQITDNFVRAFSNATQTPNARVYSVTVVNPPTQTGSSCTAISVPAAGLSASSSNSSFNFLSGLDTLKANGTVGDSCVVEVKVGIDYFVSVGNPLNTPPTLTGIVCTTPPTTGQTGCNNAVASLYPASTTVANPGVTIASAITTPMNTAIVNAPSTLLTDLSNDGIVVSNIGTSADSTPTPITYIPQQLRTRKQLAGAVTNRNVGTGIEFKVPYKVVLKNVSTVVAASNVQIVDDLRATFPFVGGSTTNPSITISTSAGETL